MISIYQLTLLCVSIFAGTNELSGEIPSELGLLTSIEELRLGHNNIDGNIPTELGSISRLKLIELDDNNLTGSIPTEFGFLSGLEVIVIGKHITYEQNIFSCYYSFVMISIYQLFITFFNHRTK